MSGAVEQRERGGRGPLVRRALATAASLATVVIVAIVLTSVAMSRLVERTVYDY